MASSPEHRGESVRITWLLDGNGPKQSCTFSGPPDARLELALAAKKLVEARGHHITRSQCYEAINGEDPAPSRRTVPTFQQWAASYIADLRRRGEPQPYTIERYERGLRDRVIPYLGGYRLDEIDREVIRGWVEWLKNSRVMVRATRKPGRHKMSDTTVRRHFSIGATCLAAAVGEWLAVSPAATPSGRRKNDLGVPGPSRTGAVFLSAGEAARILEHCHADLRDLVFVALRTGMRRGELVALRVRDVLFRRDGGVTIQVRLGRKADGSTGEPKSENSVRDITGKDEVAQILRRRVTGRRLSDPVFTHRSQRQRRGPAKRWAQSTLGVHWSQAVAAARRCEEHPPAAPKKPVRGPARQWRLDEVSTCRCPGVLRQAVRFHDTRHTHASALIAQGWPVKKIQKRLGHATFQITMDIYGHLTDLGNDRELDSMEAFFEIADEPAESRVRARRRGRRESALRHAKLARARTVLVRR
jgi:integrase